MSSTAISWTNEVWNPVTGCSHVSEGCRNCYAEALSLRHGWTKKPWTARNAAANVVLRHDRLEDPFHWRRPRRVFVNSMSDLFHELVPFSFIAEVFTTMGQACRHTFQVLTKRPERMLEFFNWNYGTATPIEAYQDWLGSWPNVWLGVSCEDQKTADERIPLLLQTPAAVRFLSCEPLLGPIDLSGFMWGRSVPCADCPKDADCDCGFQTRAQNGEPALDWVIVGGESGPDHRPMDVMWAADLYRQCIVAKVPFFMKQDSGNRPGKQGRIPDVLWVQEFPQTREAVPA